MFENTKRQIMNSRIDAGVRWLDGYFGREGWAGQINTQRLNLASGNTCMIGQLFQHEQQYMSDNFTMMLRDGLMTKEQATSRGFYLPRSSFFPWLPTNAMYKELTHLWIEKMGAMRAAQQQVVPAGSVKSPIIVGVPRKD